MICPQCDAEYRYGFWTCSDCQVSLIRQTVPTEVRKSGTPTLIAGLLIGLATVVVFLFDGVLREPMGWFVIGGLVLIAVVVLFIRLKYRV